MNANTRFRFQFKGDKYMLVDRASDNVLRWSLEVDQRLLLREYFYYDEDMELEDAHFAAAIAYSQINGESA